MEFALNWTLVAVILCEAGRNFRGEALSDDIPSKDLFFFESLNPLEIGLKRTLCISQISQFLFF